MIFAYSRLHQPMKGDGEEDIDPKADSNSCCQAESLVVVNYSNALDTPKTLQRGPVGQSRVGQIGSNDGLSLMQLSSTIGVHAHLQK